MTKKLDVSKKELDEKSKINDSLTKELYKKTQINKTLTMELKEMTKRLDEQGDEAQLLLSEERELRTKSEVTINHLTMKCNSLELDLDDANKDKKDISDILSKLNQERSSYFEKLKEDKCISQIENDKLRDETSKRSVENSSLMSRLIDYQRDNQQLENHIDEITDKNEYLASECATLEIEKSCLEGQVSAAREETIEIQQRSIATDTENQELRRQVSHHQQCVSQFEAANNTSTANRANAELITDNQSLRLQVSQLQAAITSTTDEIPFTSTFQWVTEGDFPEPIRQRLNVLKQEIVSSAVWLARMGYPNMPPILTETLDRILSTLLAKETLIGRINNSLKAMLNLALKYAKESGKYDPSTLPNKIDEAFIRRVVGCTKEEYVSKLCENSLMCISICTLLFGRRSTPHGLETDHVKARDLRLQLALSRTADDFFGIFHHTNVRFTFQDTNSLKGNVPAVASRKVIDSHGNLLRWEFQLLGPPGPENMHTRAKNNEIELYTNLVGNLATAVINAGVEYMKQNKINVLDFNFHLGQDFNITTGEFDRSISQSSELTDPPTTTTFSLPQARLTELRRLGAQPQINGKVWQVNELGVCTAKPGVNACTFFRTNKEYILTETSCQYFDSKILPVITRQIESILARDQVFSSVKNICAVINSRLDTIINSKISAWKNTSSFIIKDDTNNQYSNEAIIYRKRLIVCIMDEFRHGGADGQISRFVLKSESGSREMSYIEVAEKLLVILRGRSSR
jgi:hypothetical protein